MHNKGRQYGCPAAPGTLGMSDGSSFSHYIRFVVKPAKSLTFRDVMQNVARASRQEDGCIAFVLLKDTKETFTYGISSVWSSKDAYDAHEKTTQHEELENFMSSGGVISKTPACEYYTIASV